MMCKDMNSCLQVSYVCDEKRRVGLVVEMDTKFFDKYSCLFGCNPIFKSFNCHACVGCTLRRIQNKCLILKTNI